VLREMHVYGFPLFLGSIASILMNVVDRYALNTLSVLRSVALYTLAVKLANVIKLIVVDSVRLTIMPVFMKKMDSPDNRRFQSKILLYTSLVVMYAIVALSLFSLEITKVITSSRAYWNIVYIMPVLSLSVFFVSMKEITVYGLYIAKKSRTISYIVISATILNIVLNIILIPLWDVTGTALATLLSQAYFWFMCYFFSQKEYHVPYETGKLIILFVTGTLFAFSGLLLVNVDTIPRLIIKLFLVAIFPFILYILNFYEKAEINAVRGFVAKWSDLRRLGDNLKSLKNITDDL
jgi:O-antigen/teichoic acid export membrane protein